MKPTTSRNFENSAAAVLAVAGLVALTATTAFGDRGRGSIRAEARPAPRAEPAHAEPARAPVREAPARPEPARREPARAEPVRRDWDAGDEDARHFGGFAHPAPERVFRGARVRALPDRHFDVVWNNQHYFWDYGGGYYLAQPDGEYLAVQPPVGVLVPALPDGATPVIFGPTTYYYLDGVFYVPQANGFIVVNPPPGIVVPALPTGATQVVINGVVVYQLNGFDYTPTLEGGVTAYTVTPA